MVNAVVDTNILIDYLTGVPAAKAELSRYDVISISHVSWMEVMAGAAPGDDERRVRAFLRRYTLRPIDADVGERAVHLRRAHRIRLPDAVVWATAKQLGQLFVTRNTRDFPAGDAGIRVPYTL